MGTPLPRTDDGDVNCSAEFGETVIVQITWNTDEHNVRIDDPGGYPSTFHGPFTDEDEAQVWMDDYPEDTDIYEMVSLPLNSVRPT